MAAQAPERSRTLHVAAETTAAVIVSAVVLLFLGLPVFAIIERALRNSDVIDVASSSEVIQALRLSFETTAISLALVIAVRDAAGVSSRAQPVPRPRGGGRADRPADRAAAGRRRAGTADGVRAQRAAGLAAGRPRHRPRLHDGGGGDGADVRGEPVLHPRGEGRLRSDRPRPGGRGVHAGLVAHRRLLPGGDPGGECRR